MQAERHLDHRKVNALAAVNQLIGYRLRVLLLAALGYVYILAILGIVLMLLIGLVVLLVHGKGAVLAVKLGIPMLVLAGVILRALWVRLEPPSGHPIGPSEAPELFQQIDTIRQTLKAPPVHQVLITGDFNAALVQHPRLGVLGWQQNYLILGLPLMMALPPRQFLAVIAHEYGHLSGAHGKIASWVYRTRASWSRLMDALEQSDHWGKVVFTRFLNWYAPFLNRYSLALAREQEYQADREAVRIAGATQASSALVRVDLWARFLDETFWPGVYRLADRRSEPPASVYQTMAAAFRRGLPEGRRQVWLEDAMTAQTDLHDTHPSLKDRLAPLHGKIVPDGLMEKSAADQWLPELERIQSALASDWQGAVAAKWQERYRYIREATEHLQELRQRSRSEVLPIADAWQMAVWTEELETEQAAFPLYREILGREPNHAGALFALGRIALKNGNGKGGEFVEKAMTLDHRYVPDGCQVLAAFLRERGDEKQAALCDNRSAKYLESLRLGREERERVHLKDIFIHHGLNVETLKAVQLALREVKEIRKAYLVRKQMTHFPDEALFLLGIERTAGIRMRDDDQAFSQTVLDRLQLPGEVMGFCLNGRNRRFRQKLRRVQGAQVHPAI